MPNTRRGEIEGILDGRPLTLCLTLGALAELETAFGDDNMLALAQRFESGRLSSRDCIRIIAAGLRGAGHQATEETVALMHADGGARGYVDIVARLLRATFAAEGPAAPTVSLQSGAVDRVAARAEDGEPASPFLPARSPRSRFPGTT